MKSSCGRYSSPAPLSKLLLPERVAKVRHKEGIMLGGRGALPENLAISTKLPSNNHSLGAPFTYFYYSIPCHGKSRTVLVDTGKSLTFAPLSNLDTTTLCNQNKYHR